MRLCSSRQSAISLSATGARLAVDLIGEEALLDAVEAHEARVLGLLLVVVLAAVHRAVEVVEQLGDGLDALVMLVGRGVERLGLVELAGLDGVREGPGGGQHRVDLLRHVDLVLGQRADELHRRGRRALRSLGLGGLLVGRLGVGDLGRFGGGRGRRDGGGRGRRGRGRGGVGGGDLQRALGVRQQAAGHLVVAGVERGGQRLGEARDDVLALLDDVRALKDLPFHGALGIVLDLEDRLAGQDRDARRLAAAGP